MAGSLGTGLFGYLCDAVGHDRVYPLRLPQGATMPAIAYQVMPGPGALYSHDDAHGGEGSARNVFHRSRIQVSVWGDTYPTAEATADVVERALGGFRGTWGPIVVGSCLVDVTMDDVEPTTRKFRRILQAVVQWQDGDGS